MPCCSAPTVTATSPVTTPTRIRSPGAPTSAPSAVDVGDQVEPGAHAALGVVLVRGGGAPHRHHRVADELLHGAAVAGDDPAALVEVARQQLADLLLVTLLRERREGDEVAEQHAGDAAGRDRPTGEPGSGRRRSTHGVPHSLQNFAPATSAAPHVAQRASPCGAPQAKQNLAPGCCSAPHVAHPTARSPVGPSCRASRCRRGSSPRRPCASPSATGSAHRTRRSGRGRGRSTS